jgi:molybdate transport system substrate-binding protein
MRDIVGEIAHEFERMGGGTVVAEFTRSGLVRDRMHAGERADVAVSTKAAIDDLAARGKILPDTAAIVARSGIGVAVRAGVAKPDIGSVEAFRNALREASSLAMADPATGSPSANYLVGLFERLGLTAELKARTRLVGAEGASAVVVCDVVARGEAEIGIQQISEILPVSGVEFVGPLPAELQHMTAFAAAVGAESAQPQSARRFLALLASDAAASVIRANGMEPP